MTRLVEQIRLDITLHRDDRPDFPFDDIAPGLRRLPRKGQKRIGDITIAWEKFGAEEIAETTAGDN